MKILIRILICIVFLIPVNLLASEPCYLSYHQQDVTTHDENSKSVHLLLKEYIDNRLVTMPSAGIRTSEANCIYEVTASKTNGETKLLISGKNLKSITFSTDDGSKGMIQATLKAIHKVKPIEICKKYSNLVRVECGLEKEEKIIPVVMKPIPPVVRNVPAIEEKQSFGRNAWLYEKRLDREEYELAAVKGNSEYTIAINPPDRRWVYVITIDRWEGEMGFVFPNRKISQSNNPLFNKTYYVPSLDSEIVLNAQPDTAGDSMVVYIIFSKEEVNGMSNYYNVCPRKDPLNTTSGYCIEGVKGIIEKLKKSDDVGIKEIKVNFYP